MRKAGAGWWIGTGVALTLVCAVWPEPLQAGAWTRTPGDGLIIFSSGRQVGPVGALAGGVADEDSTTTQFFAEYGLIEGLTLGGTLFVDISTSDLGGGSAAAGAFLRKRVWAGDHGVFSVQAGYSQPIEDLLPGDLGATNSSSVPEVEMRLLYGHSLWGDWGSAFFAGDIGYDWRSNEEPDEFRLNLTTGYEPWHCCLAIMSLFTTVPVDGEDAALQLAPSIAYTLFPEFERNGKKPQGPIMPSTIQVGLNYDLLNTGDGLGVQLSVWRRF